QAFDDAKATMRKARISRDIITITERKLRGKSTARYTRDRVAQANQVDWRMFASPGLLRPMDAVEALILRYPEKHRIMPTKLGNALRSGEDSLKLEKNEDLEGFVYRRYGLMSPDLKAEHDRYRSQLDIYCVLACLFAALAAASPIVLPHSLVE